MLVPAAVCIPQYQDFLDTLRTEAPEFAGKAMRDTRDLEGASESLASSTSASAAGSPIGPAGHPGLRQLLAIPPTPDQMQLLGIDEKGDSNVAATVSYPYAGLQQLSGFDGVKRR